MISLLATRGASTKLRNSPFTETAIAAVHGVIYRPGVAPIAFGGPEIGEGPIGTYGRGPYRIAGILFSYDGDIAETLFNPQSDIDLIVRYRSNGQKRKRTFFDVLFIGDAEVTFPSLNTGIPEPIGVPFRVQIPLGETFSSHVLDELEA